MGSKWMWVATSVAAISMMLLAAPAAQAQTERVLYSFTGGADGLGPSGGLIQDSNGNLYGTTSQGGSGCNGMGCGVVFKLSPAGIETVLHTFTGGADGSYPQAGVIQDAKGNLYGTTTVGGTGCLGSGCGIVFKLNPAGKLTVLHRFRSGADGAYPQAGLIQDARGNLYGTTTAGGGDDVGVVFKLSSAGKETVLHAFTGVADGSTPNGLIQDAKGNLYGTTMIGGGVPCNGRVGCGVVFKLSPAGKVIALYTFAGLTDGNLPHAGLTQDAKGNLYGTTYQGGDLSSCDCGVVFKLSPARKLTVLHKFGGADGSNPEAGVVRDAKGNLYGTTFYSAATGCIGGCGVVFQLSPTGKETTLYTFTGGADGANLQAGVIRDAKGILYGEASGGANQSGVVFEIQ